VFYSIALNLHHVEIFSYFYMTQSSLISALLTLKNILIASILCFI